MPQECPQSVADLIKACCAADPVQRPTAKEVVACLRRASREQAPEAAAGSSGSSHGPVTGDAGAGRAQEGHRRPSVGVERPPQVPAPSTRQQQVRGSSIHMAPIPASPFAQQQ